MYEKNKRQKGEIQLLEFSLPQACAEKEVLEFLVGLMYIS